MAISFDCIQEFTPPNFILWVLRGSSARSVTLSHLTTASYRRPVRIALVRTVLTPSQADTPVIVTCISLLWPLYSLTLLYVYLYLINNLTIFWINELIQRTNVTDKLIVPQMMKNSTHLMKYEVPVPRIRATYIQSIHFHPICSTYSLIKFPTWFQDSLQRFTSKTPCSFLFSRTFSTRHAYLTLLNDTTGRSTKPTTFPSAMNLKDSYELQTGRCVRNSIFLSCSSIRPEVTFKTTVNIWFETTWAPNICSSNAIKSLII